MPAIIPPPHPGETIREDILEPLEISVNQLAKALGITAARLNDIVRGRRGITADTALRLARYLGTSAEFWLRMQADYDHSYYFIPTFADDHIQYQAKHLSQ